MAPAIEVSTLVEETSILQSSITEIGGNSGIEMGEGTAPGDADARTIFLFDED